MANGPATPGRCRRPDRPAPWTAGTAAIGAGVHLRGAVIELGRAQFSMRGVLADAA
ncbi:hypothetical protein [Streptomyces camponoticapitis]|uniref:hypothetical protein n=1 Tax=Streptomyces camponoticapitis TaxID=1616125 RepID=UPI0016691A5E|nr:hypothetical protein [Streptomyces camponoticapitis]